MSGIAWQCNPYAEFSGFLISRHVLEHGQQCFANMIFDLILREWFSISIGCFRRTGVTANA